MTRILITGGSGFLGRGIMRYWSDNIYTVLSRDEFKQDLAKQKQHPNHMTKWVLGDVLDYDRLAYTMRANDIELVIHAAAIKYIPEAEKNVDEAVRVNVDGSRNVIKAAIAAGVKRVVGISTDKAVQPVNVYGMTKALMERLFIEANEYSPSQTVFTLTRYGNVVGSTGSVIPLFQRQAASMRAITITDPKMTRYWQSAEESVELIKLAAVADAGDIIVPDGRAMDLQQLAATIGGPACLVDVIGARPGEKQHETLIGKHEGYRTMKKWGPYNNNHYVVVPFGRTQGPDSVNCPWVGDPFQFELTSRTARQVGAQELIDMIRVAETI